MNPLKYAAMTLLGAICLVLLAPLIAAAALLYPLLLFLLWIAEYPRFRRAGFPGRFSRGVTRTRRFRLFRRLPPEQRAAARLTEDGLFFPGDRPLLLLIPDAFYWYRAKEASIEDGFPDDWLAECPLPDGEIRTLPVSERIRRAEADGCLVLVFASPDAGKRGPLSPETVAAMQCDPHFCLPDVDPAHLPFPHEAV